MTYALIVDGQNGMIDREELFEKLDAALERRLPGQMSEQQYDELRRSWGTGPEAEQGMAGMIAMVSAP